jgi:hypothetical protein
MTWNGITQPFSSGHSPREGQSLANLVEIVTCGPSDLGMDAIPLVSLLIAAHVVGMNINRYCSRPSTRVDMGQELYQTTQLPEAFHACQEDGDWQLRL